MSKSIEEIKELIATKIAGQGNQVDSGGALNDILNALVDALADVPTKKSLHITKIVTSDDINNVQNLQDLAFALDIEGTKVEDLSCGKYDVVIFDSLDGYSVYFNNVAGMETAGEAFAVYGGSGGTAQGKLEFSLTHDYLSAEVTLGY